MRAPSRQRSGCGLRGPAAWGDHAAAGRARHPCGRAIASRRGTRPGRHGHAWLRAARRGERFVQATHIGKARLETEEVDDVFGRGMATHDFGRGQAGVLGDVTQVGAIVTAIGDFNVDQLAVGHQCLAVFPCFAQQGFEHARVGQRTKHEREVVHTGDHVYHASPVGRARGHGPDALLAIQGRRRRHFAQQRQFAQPVNRALQLSPRSRKHAHGGVRMKTKAIR